MISNRLLGPALPVIMLAVAIAGCGSEGGTTPSGAGTVTRQHGLPLLPSSLTKVQLLARANKFCRESWAAMLKAFSRLRAERGSRMSATQLFAYSTKNYFLPNIQFWFDDISYMGEPRGAKPETQSMIQVLQPEDTLQLLQLAVFSAQEQRVTDAKELSAIFSSYNRLARQYGFDDCLVEESSFQ